MSSEEPITGWIDGLRLGDESAARKIWQHFAERLCDTIRHRIHPKTRRVYDDEDAAVSAFGSLCAGISAGRFPDLNDRESLWRLMLVIASRKVTRRCALSQNWPHSPRVLWLPPAGGFSNPT